MFLYVVFIIVSSCYFQVRGKFLDRSARSVKLVRLFPDTRYLICVLGLGSWGPPLSRQQANMTGDVLLGEPVPHLTDSQMSRCTEVSLWYQGGRFVSTIHEPQHRKMLTVIVVQVRTLEGEEGLENQDRGRGSILTRRLGLIVGSCMGFVVFIVLVSVLGYLKLKKQRECAKREQPGPAEYLSYRHFSLQTADPLGPS